MSENCTYRVYQSHSFQGTRHCFHKAVDGTPFCKRHQPDAIKARNAAKCQKWDVEHAANHKKYMLQYAAPLLLQACKEAINEIEYLQEKFKATGSGNQVLSKLKAAVEKAEQE